MLRTLGLGIILGTVWLLWSGHLEGLLLLLGALSCVVVLVAARRLLLADAEGAPFELALRLPRYLPWLAWQVLRANLDVANRILRRRIPIRPSLIRVPASFRSDVARALYANSITLTPGTVSVDVEGEEIVVHALTREAAAELLEGGMAHRVSRLEGDA